MIRNGTELYFGLLPLVIVEEKKTSRTNDIFFKPKNNIIFYGEKPPKEVDPPKCFFYLWVKNTVRGICSV